MQQLVQVPNRKTLVCLEQLAMNTRQKSTFGRIQASSTCPFHPLEKLFWNSMGDRPENFLKEAEK